MEQEICTYMEFVGPREEQFLYKACINPHSVRKVKTGTKVESTQCFNSPSIAFRFNKLGKTIRQTSCKARLCLHTDLHSLHWTEGNICNEFSRSRSRKVNQGLVLCSILRASNVWVILLEEFVETELACSLSTVSKQGGYPASEKTLGALLFQQNTKTRRDALVLSRIDLKFNQYNVSLVFSMHCHLSHKWA